MTDFPKPLSSPTPGDKAMAERPSRAEQVRALRDEYGIGLQTAGQILRGEDLTHRIETARSVDDLKSVLLEMVREFYPKRPGF